MKDQGKTGEKNSNSHQILSELTKMYHKLYNCSLYNIHYMKLSSAMYYQKDEQPDADNIEFRRINNMRQKSISYE